MKRTAWHVGLVLILGAVLATAGCTGTDFLVTNNTLMRFEVVIDESNTIADFECINMKLGNVWIKPLDGTCSAGSTNPGEPCLQTEDCPSGSCEGSSASEVISLPIALQNGVNSSVGNLTGAPCDFDAPVGFDPQFSQPFVQPNPLLLSAGLYVVSSFNISGLQLYDHDTSTLHFCESSISVSDAFGPGLRFNVPATGEKLVQIVAHIDVWEAEMDAVGSGDCSIVNALTDAFSCPTCDAAP